MLRGSDVAPIHVTWRAWLKWHFMREDAAKLQFVSWVKLEEFVADPAAELAKLWAAAGLSGDVGAAAAGKLIAADGVGPSA